jgi:hypothetical protein
MDTARHGERGFNLEPRGAHFGYREFTLVELNANRTFTNQRLATRGFRLATRAEASHFFSEASIPALSRQTSNALEVIVFQDKGCFSLRSIWDQFPDVVVSDGDPGHGYYALCVNLPPIPEGKPETVH